MNHNFLTGIVYSPVDAWTLSSFVLVGSFNVLLHREIL